MGQFPVIVLSIYLYLVSVLHSAEIGAKKNISKEEEGFLDSGILSFLGFDLDLSPVDIDPCDEEEYRWTDVCLAQLAGRVNMTAEDDSGYMHTCRAGDCLAEFTTTSSPHAYVIIHGWLDDSQMRWVTKMKTALLRKANGTVLLIDWSEISRNPYYPGVSGLLPRLGKALAQVLTDLVKAALLPPFPDITCIGHSLGAHLCGFIGKSTPPAVGPLGRISGLDPAGPGYMFASSEERLDAGDATFVDVIHTSVKFPKALGLAKPIGHVDFYPNHGGTQPGCAFVDIVCSHNKVLDYYTRSIYNDCFSVYKKCFFLDLLYFLKYCHSSWFNEMYNKMGFAANTYDARGSFYLETTGEKPYCI